MKAGEATSKVISLGSQISSSVYSSNYFTESKHRALHRNTELKVERESKIKPKNHNLIKDMI